MLKNKLIGDKDFNDLLSEEIGKITINDMITLKKSSNLAPRVLSKLNKKLEKIKAQKLKQKIENEKRITEYNRRQKELKLYPNK